MPENKAIVTALPKLELTEAKFQPLKIYVLDFDKIQTVEDIKAILKKLDIKITGNAIKGIEHIIKEE